jgi:ribosome maturation factor RimP
MSTMISQELRREIEALVEGLGLELVSLEWKGTGRKGEVQVTVDRAGGVGIDDCQKVSRHLGVLLDLRDPFPARYTLKVSSPGIDRPLRTERDFLRAIGKAVRFQHENTVIKGILTGCAEGRLEVAVREERRTYPLGEVRAARLLGPWEEA